MTKASGNLVFLLAMLVTGCGSAVPAETPEVAAPAVDEKRLSSVRLTEPEQQQAGIEIGEVAARTVPETLHAPGRITFNEERSWRVGAVVDGRVIDVLVNPGDSVQPEQVLARMHSHDIHEGRADHQKALAELSRLRLVADFAERTRDRYRRLFELKAASQEQVDHSEVEFRGAQSAIGNAQVDVERTRAHLEEFLGVPARPTELNDDDDLIPIRSPAAGVVLSRSITPGTVVAPSTEAFLISNLSTLWMIAAVDEASLSRIRPGLAVRVGVRAYPEETFRGRVSRIGEQLDPATRTVSVRVDLPNNGRLKPEMYATADIELPGIRPALFIPESAPQDVNGQTVVFVRTSPDRFELRPVTTGRVTGGRMEVTAGLKDGDQVVFKGGFFLKAILLKTMLEEGPEG